MSRVEANGECFTPHPKQPSLLCQLKADGHEYHEARSGFHWMWDDDGKPPEVWP